jgi:hypothetical protein
MLLCHRVSYDNVLDVSGNDHKNNVADEQAIMYSIELLSICYYKQHYAHPEFR